MAYQRDGLRARARSLSRSLPRSLAPSLPRSLAPSLSFSLTHSCVCACMMGSLLLGQFRIGNTADTPLMVSSGEEEGGLVAVEATGPVFVGKGATPKRSIGERIPVIGEDCNFNR